MANKVEYLLRRLGLAILVLLSVSIVTFVIARVIPSDPVALWVGPRATTEQLAEAREELGLDRPLTVQYFDYITGVIQGNLGVSVRTHRPVVQDLKQRLPATFELVLFGMFWAVIIGIPVGVLSGANPDSFLDHVSRFLAIAGVSIPTFWLGLLLQLLFFGTLGVLPLGGRVDRSISLYHPIQFITGFNLIDSLITTNWAGFKSSLSHIILPSFSLATFSIGLAIRMTRSSMIEVLQEDYIVAARAAGLPERLVLFKLALKNAITPTLTMLGLAFVYALTGAILVEVIFSWPGLGKYVTDAVLNVDFPVILSVTLISTFFYVLVNLALDLIQGFIDPRVTLG